MKRFLIILASFFAVFFLLGDSAFAQTPLIRPVQVQNVTMSSVDIIWKSSNGGTSQVKYGTTTSYERGAVSGSSGRKQIDGSPGYLHRVTITGLSAGTKYFYQVISNGAGLSSAGDQTYFFKTSPPYGSTTPFNWAIWGDSGNGGSNQKAVAAQALNKAPELTFVAGDVSYGAGYGGFPSLTGEPQQDSNHYDIYAALSRFSPFYLACGNHDNNDNNTPAGIKSGCDVMIDDQVMPNGGRVSQASGAYDDVIYSFNYGNVHYTIINDNPESPHDYSSPASGSPQMLWAYNDLKNSNMPWKVLIGHTNYWSSGSHSVISNMSGATLLAQDAGVQVMIWGHSHVYERFSRFAAQGHAGCSTAGGCRDKGPYYYTIGNGGQAGTTSACGSYTNGPQCIVASGLGSIPGGSGFLFVQTNGSQMTFNYITQTGAQPDSKTMSLAEWGGAAPPPPTATQGVIPTPTRTRTPTPTTFNAPSPTRTRTPTPTSIGAPSPSRTRTPTPQAFPTVPTGGVCTYFRN